MRVVTMYAADDGTIFDTPEAAEKRDREAAFFAELLSPLGTGPTREATPVQHDPTLVQTIRASVVSAALPDLPDLAAVLQAFSDGKTLSGSLIGRLLDGGDPRAYAWYRLTCIDKTGREWTQPYFATVADGGPRE